MSGRGGAGRSRQRQHNTAQHSPARQTELLAEVEAESEAKMTPSRIGPTGRRRRLRTAPTAVRNIVSHVDDIVQNFVAVVVVVVLVVVVAGCAIFSRLAIKLL